ncbi:MAG TPA: GNAT family N-acetyltransferase [Actinocrinis sp.]|nr:GNAT family N-acetyltransferase [Actinocrinis sp.]
MAWHLTSELETFDTHAGAFVNDDPAQNTIFVTITAMLRRRGLRAFGSRPPRFGWYEGADGQVEAVFVRTPPHPIRMSAASPQAAEELAQLLASTADGELGPDDLSGVGAPVGAAEAFSARWCELTGASASIHMRQRLFRLGELVVPSPAPAGRARVAGAADRDLLLAWYRAFAAEVGEHHADFERIVDDRIEYGGLTLWEADGAPVSLAGATRVIQGTSRVAPVYTPKESRGRGFGGAATAAVSQAALDAGAREVLLFTDLANPTSNALYQRLGYRPIGDLMVHHFTDPHSSPAR